MTTIVDELQQQLNRLQQEIDEVRTYELNYVSRLDVNNTGTGAGLGEVIASGAGTFGKAKVGTDPSHGTNYASFWNKDISRDTTNYCLLHQNDGTTWLNADGGKNINVQNDNVTVLTINTDVYTVAWTDYSTSSTIVGFSSYTTKSIYYKKIGRLVFVQFRLEGPSNSANTTFTLPYTQQANVRLLQIVRVRDNTGTRTSGLLALDPSSSTVNLYSTPAAAGWTAGGTKEVEGAFIFEATA